MFDNEPSIDDFLRMTSDNILRLRVNEGLFKEKLCQKYNSSYHNNHPLNINCLALKYFLQKLKCGQRAELFDTVLPKLKVNFCQALEQYFESTDNERREMMSLLDSTCSTISDTFQTTLEGDVEMDDFRSLSIGVLDLLRDVYKLLNERNLRNQENSQNSQSDYLEQLVHKIEVLRSKMIGVLISNDVNYFSKLTITDVNFFNRPAIWKCITVLCTGKVLNWIEGLIVANFDLAYLLVAVKTACSCIESSIKEICETTSEETISIKYHSKAIPFLISVLQRLAVNYPHDKFGGHEHVLKILFTVMRSASIFPHLNHKVTSDLRNVLFLIFKCNNFVKCYNQASIDEFSSEILHSGLEILQKILKDFDHGALQYVIEGSDSIVSKMFECMCKEIASWDNSLYKKLVVSLSSTLIMASTSNAGCNIAVRFLVRSSLENSNILVGYLLTDVWSIWAKFLPDYQCYNLVLFWSKINDKFSLVQMVHLQSAFVKVLLRNLYDLLPDSQKRMLYLNKPVMRNVKLWATLGIVRVPPEQTKDVLRDVEKKMEEFYKTLLQERSETALFKLIEILRISETKSRDNGHHVPECLMELWKMNFTQQPSKYSPFIITLIRNSISFKRSLNNHQHYQILQSLATIANSLNINVPLKIEIINYLRNISIEYFTVEYQNEILRNICQLFNKSLSDSDPIVKTLAFSTFTDVIRLAKHESIAANCLSDNHSLNDELRNFHERKISRVRVTGEQRTFLLQLGSCSYHHKCAEPKSTTNDVRLCISDDESSNELRIAEIISRMQSDVKDLIELNKFQKLSQSFREDITKFTEQLMLLE